MVSLLKKSLQAEEALSPSLALYGGELSVLQSVRHPALQGQVLPGEVPAEDGREEEEKEVHDSVLCTLYWDRLSALYSSGASQSRCRERMSLLSLNEKQIFTQRNNFSLLKPSV